jgi:hypothetical protein
LDKYHELLGILKQIKVGKTGVVNKALGELKEKVYIFLKEYDEDGNEEIDIDELTKERIKFSNELSKVEEIVDAIKKLEDKVISYKQGDVVEEKDSPLPTRENQTDFENEFKQKKIELEIQLKKVEGDCQKIKKEFLEKKVKLFFIKKLEESEELEKEVSDLKEKLSEMEKEKNNIRKQLIKVKISLLKHRVRSTKCEERIEK